MPFDIEIAPDARDRVAGLTGEARSSVWVHLLTAAEAAELGAPATQFGDVIEEGEPAVVIGRTGSARVVYAIDRARNRLYVLGLLFSEGPSAA